MQKNKKIKVALSLFWLLLIYIIAALIWWYISLEKQNTQLYHLKFENANVLEQSVLNSSPQQQFLTEKKRNTRKHIAEGITFLAIILVGAFYIYRIVKKQIKAIDLQNNFIMAVTHELKTPIAIAQLNIETLQKRQIDAAIQQKLLNNTQKELFRLNDLASNILVVSQIEREGYKLKIEEVNLSEIITTTVTELNVQHKSRITITSLEINLTTLCDPLLIKLVATNLIDNALKYSDNTVEVALTAVGSKITLSVADQGSGIADEEKNKVFEKFYRQGNEITRTKKGTGLGLYLCKKIVSEHKGSITIKDNTPTGSVFTVSLIKK